ncbi:MAG: DUF6516 family protein [Methanothrix sp.]|nr:DUF6516 family protein [Methanothrix sp.]
MNVQEILEALSSSDSDIVLETSIITLVLEPGRQALRANASLRGDINSASMTGKDFRSYSYHLLKGDLMVRRWDNAPHWPRVKTFPHHLHLSDEASVVESAEAFIDDVLNAITEIINSGKID